MFIYLHQMKSKVLKEKKCKECGKVFRPYRPLVPFCSVSCMVAYKEKNKKAKKLIKKISDKLSKGLKVYNGKRIIFLAENKECFAKYNGCYGEATDVHHSRGRGKYLNDTSTWLPLCRSCHIYIETHPKEAKERGFSKNRLCE